MTSFGQFFIIFVSRYDVGTRKRTMSPIETQGSCTALATKSQGAHASYSCAAIPQQYTVYS